MIVYSLSKAATGETVLFGWGPANDPLSPLVPTDEGKALTQGVAEGKLVLKNLLGTEVSGLNAARIVGLLSPRSNCGKRGVPVAVIKSGRVSRFPSIAAAARSLGLSWTNLNWSLHFLPTVAIYAVPAKRVTRKLVASVVPTVPILSVAPR
ncbi:MAG: hypothetical protein ACLP9L_42725 [Thermoguttaceae bacterium]